MRFFRRADGTVITPGLPGRPARRAPEARGGWRPRHALVAVLAGAFAPARAAPPDPPRRLDGRGRAPPLMGRTDPCSERQKVLWARRRKRPRQRNRGSVDGLQLRQARLEAFLELLIEDVGAHGVADQRLGSAVARRCREMDADDPGLGDHGAVERLVALLERERFSEDGLRARATA